jgi:hypothetical protein
VVYDSDVLVDARCDDATDGNSTSPCEFRKGECSVVCDLNWNAPTNPGTGTGTGNGTGNGTGTGTGTNTSTLPDITPIDLDISTATAKLTGAASGNAAGVAAAFAGDVNGDGKTDVITGAALVGGVVGEAYITLGGTEGTSSLGDADTTFTAELGIEFAGYQVSGAGDTNGDGNADVVITAIGPTDLPSGIIYHLEGPFSSTTPLGPTVAGVLVGEEPGDIAGRSLAPAGDVNNDGFDDLIVGTESGSGYSPMAAAVMFGPANGIESLSVADARFDWSIDDFEDPLNNTVVAGAGDVDGDGVDDVVLGQATIDVAGGVAATDMGAAMVAYGPLSGATMTTDLPSVFVGAAGALAGFDVGGAGDTNADGRDDIWVTALGAQEAYLVRGSAQASTGVAALVDVATATIVASGDDGISSIDGAGDLNGDGRTDVVISAPWFDTDTGRVWVFYGPVIGSLDLSEAHVTFIGAASGDRFGESISGGGDTNGDGLADLVIGAASDSEGGAGAGAVYIFQAPFEL